MILNVSNRHNIQRAFPLAEACKSNSAPVAVNTKPQTSLQAQLNFMGGINKPLVNTSSSLLGEYFKKMNHYKFNDVTMLYKGQKNPWSGIILFNKPVPFTEALPRLTKNIEEIGGSKSKIEKMYLFLHGEDFKFFEDAIEHNDKLKDIPIKGIIGQGLSSTAFLTDQDEVIKLSRVPIFPDLKEIIKDVEIPIKEIYFSKTDKSGMIYGMKEPLVENTLVRDVSDGEYKEIWTDFYQKIKKENSEYEFESDFSLDDSTCSKQLGFIADKPYLIDHQCIKFRPLCGAISLF